MNYTRFVSTGAYLPEATLSNTELSKTVETSHEWIVERTGIESRHIASHSETTTLMGALAAKEALETAGVSPKDVDMIVVATCTPDKFFPSTACLIQEALCIPNCPAFDISAACSGFMYGLSIADQFVRSGMAKRPLLIGTEAMSRVVDWQDRRTCVLFGDGAAAVLLEAAETPGILGTHMSADGHHKDILSLDNVEGACIYMEGGAVYKQAVRRLGEIATNMLAEHQLSVEDLDWLVPHQANVRIIQATAERLGLPMEKVILRVATQGNTSAASVPLALDYGIRSGQIKRGQHLLLEAFGGGLTWGSALVRY